MTATHKSNAPTKRVCLTYEQIKQHLLDHQIQPTAQRIAICRHVLCEADHPSAEDVKAWVDQNFPKMSLATVYNTLGLLVQAGLLREFRFAHSDKVIYDNNLTDHYHFLDEDTGELVDISSKDVKILAQLGNQFQIRSMDLLLRGKRKLKPSKKTSAVPLPKERRK